VADDFFDDVLKTIAKSKPKRLKKQTILPFGSDLKQQKLGDAPKTSNLALDYSIPNQAPTPANFSADGCSCSIFGTDWSGKGKFSAVFL
jgi:hypothetical protein